ncbi:MAG: hypothetical protein IT424_08410 [Pirellulales bacterium]|nr:hypothetical protein [Pirellulales bacterium]
MRSINSRNRNLGIRNARQSAKSIAGRAMDRLSLDALFGVSMGFASRMWHSVRGALSYTPPTATRTVKPRVTGGALRLMLQRPGQHAAACCLAAR